MKPYQQVPIQECGEPLVPLADFFSRDAPPLCGVGSALWSAITLLAAAVRGGSSAGGSAISTSPTTRLADPDF